tara:strand:+ start:4053 stop:4382 length:330 start_codon:yes stop_codon:yes gene_type:complete
MMINRFIDARMMARDFPETFQVPSSEEIATLNVGDFVKVACEFKVGGERFWVQIFEVGEKRRWFKGDISNVLGTDLLESWKEGLVGNEVLVFADNIYDYTYAEANEETA